MLLLFSSTRCSDFHLNASSDLLFALKNLFSSSSSRIWNRISVWDESPPPDIVSWTNCHGRLLRVHKPNTHSEVGGCDRGYLNKTLVKFLILRKFKKCGLACYDCPWSVLCLPPPAPVHKAPERRGSGRIKETGSLFISVYCWCLQPFMTPLAPVTWGRGARGEWGGGASPPQRLSVS